MTSPEEIHSRLASVIERTFDLPPGSAPTNAALGSTARWDSLGHIELMVAVESEFGVAIRSDQVWSLNSFARLSQLLEDTLAR